VVNGKLTIKDENESSPMFEYQLEADTFDVRDGSYTDISIDEHRDEITEIAESPNPIQRLVDSLAPHISRDENLTAIMEALVLQMIGTNSKDVDGAASYRGDWHMLLLGDPGTAKSELLEEVESLAPRAKFKSGKGVSKAGMSAAAVPDDFGPSKWSLKAGLLVLANNGIACLDEIDKVDEEALDAAHSALENQRVSITKAGIDADLPSRTSLLAAGNPKDGRFDPYQTVPEQIDLPPSLLSRFDLIYLLRDQPDTSRDAEIASHVTEAWSDAGRMAAGEDVEDARVERDIEDETFTAYIAAARQEVTPTIPDDILSIAEERFVELRTANGDDAETERVPVTPRKLEAILRLAESSARARFAETVTKNDIDRAYRLVRRSMQQVGVDPETGEFDSDVVTTGQSQTQKQRKAAIRSAFEEAKDSLTIDELTSILDGYDDSKIIDELDNLFESGDVYQPEDGHYRAV
jgi:replicative DNA helicase Mcm